MMANFVVRVMLKMTNHLIKLIVCTILMIPVWSSAVAQPYGNEWINFNQSYYQFKVAETGVYVIDRNTLSNSGFPVASVPASRIQIFRRGEEIALDVATQADGTIESINFYAKANDGAGDTELYVVPDAQINPEYSLFSDSASYFLTYYLNNQDGLRMDDYTEANTSGIPAENYHLRNEVNVFNSDYAQGAKYGNDNVILSSRYDFGEGWTGTFFQRNQASSYEYSFPNLLKEGPNPTIQLQIVGGNNLTHAVQIEVGSSLGSLRTLNTVNFSGFTANSFESNLQWSDFGDNGSFAVQITPLGVGGAADRISIASIEITLSEQFEMDSEEEKYFNLEANTSGKSFIRVTNPPSNTALLDITADNEPIKIGVNQSGSQFIGVIRNTAVERNLFAYSTTTSIDEINEVSFDNIDPAQYNYLIISNPALRTGGDPVQQYANYRESENGGSYSVYIAEIQDLFNQFNYGDPSPLAIRRFADYMLDGGDPRYMFIIGKGVTVAADYYRKDPNSLDYVNYVPTFGLPGGDIPFTAGLNDSQYESEIPTGRINVLETSQITSYLNKVIEKEATPYSDFWLKNTLHLSGGKFVSEQDSFRGFIDDFEEVVTGDFMGGQNSSFSKNTTDETEFINVTGVVNDGVSLVTFFGHSSSYSSDIEIGNVSDPVFAYRNQGKYPVFLVNGCNAGAVYNASDFVGWGDDWILTPDLGAVGFIASAGLAFSTNLKRFSDLFYRYSFSEESSFGTGIGDAMQLSGREFINLYGNSETSIAQVQQFILNGDPAIQIFGAQQPDYDIQADDVDFKSFNDELILAETDSFYIEVIVKNFGRSVSEDLEVSAIRTLEDGTVITYDPQSFDRVLYQDTLNYVIYRDPLLNESGTSRFEIFIDPQNNTEELNEGNNSVVVNLDIFSGSTTNLYPTNFGIVPEESVDLIFQTSSLLSEERNILIEIDTTSDFSSAWKRENVILTNLIAEWSLDFNITDLQDGTVFYWRTSLQDPTSTESDEWVESSFTYIESSPKGWMQSSRAQLEKLINSGVNLQDNKLWEFQTTNTSIDITTHGSESGLTSDDVDVIINEFDYTVVSVSEFAPCANNTLNVMVFDRRSTQPYQAIPINGADVLNRLVCGKRPQVIYNLLERDVTGIDTTTSNNSTQHLTQLIDNAKEGDQVLLFNMGRVNFSQWDTDLRLKLEEIGIASSSIDLLTDGQPFIIQGKKGSAPGTALIISENGSSDPILQQVLQNEINISGSDGLGSIKSLKIGPATSWISFEQSINTEGTDSFESSIIGLDTDNIRTEIISDIVETERDISTVSSNDYQYLELDLTIIDETEQTAPQLDQWKVLYEETPDALLISFNDNLFVKEGEIVTNSFGFYNYGDIPFEGPLEVVYSYFNQPSRTNVQDTIMIDAPLPGDTTLFEFDFETIGFDGLNDLTVDVNTNGVPELYLINNSLRYTSLIEVERDEINPILDVTVDGRHIQNGELVSANPTVIAKIWDENPFLLKQDTIGILVYYKPPCDSGCDFTQIYFSDSRLSWEPASETSDFKLTFSLSDLEDGEHGVQIQAEDASGNQIGDPFETNFSVNSLPFISDLKAFPNPFSNGVRFSFNATGSVAPDFIRIQILSLRGTLIREITIDDPDIMNVGQVTTPFIWDGTDNTGLPLTNGMYFYKVFIGRNDDQDAYGFFENAVGRLILLR